MPVGNVKTIRLRVSEERYPATYEKEQHAETAGDRVRGRHHLHRYLLRSVCQQAQQQHGQRQDGGSGGAPLKSGTVIVAADVSTIQWPGVHTPKGTFETVDQVIGKTVFDAIGSEELVAETHLASKQSGGGSGVPAGMRAVTIHVTDSSGVMGMLRTGQKVDVQVVLGKTGAETTVRTALEDLQVLAVNTTGEGTSQGTILPAVTLLAGPAQADVLAAADSGARVRLTLRNPLDDETRTNAPVSLGAWFIPRRRSEGRRR